MTTRDATQAPDRSDVEQGIRPKSRAWALHRRALVAVALLVLPVAWIDRTYLGPSPGAWISLDLRGVLIGAFVVYFVVHVAITSSLVALPVVQHEEPDLQRARVYSIHALTLIAFAFLGVVGFVLRG
jgi:hypothetical protein